MCCWHGVAVVKYGVHIHLFKPLGKLIQLLCSRIQMTAGHASELPLVKDAALKDLLEIMSHPNPDDRADVGDILQHCYTRADDPALLACMVIGIGGVLGDKALPPEQAATKALLLTLVDNVLSPVLADSQMVKVGVLTKTDRWVTCDLPHVSNCQPCYEAACLYEHVVQVSSCILPSDCQNCFGVMHLWLVAQCCSGSGSKQCSFPFLLLQKQLGGLHPVLARHSPGDGDDSPFSAVTTYCKYGKGSDMCRLMSDLSAHPDRLQAQCLQRCWVAIAVTDIY